MFDQNLLAAAALYGPGTRRGGVIDMADNVAPDNHLPKGRFRGKEDGPEHGYADMVTVIGGKRLHIQLHHVFFDYQPPNLPNAAEITRCELRVGGISSRIGWQFVFESLSVWHGSHAKRSVEDRGIWI